MREEAGARYLSPLVKQDLAKLDTDGESRRLALKSLKQFIEQLDAASMPKFLSQIAESREAGVSRSYAISLYEEVARVHRKLIKPHLPRVMSSVIRALAASGSSPQLQQACAKVTAAMARYTIDSTMSIEDAEDIIREVCDPLAEALTGKLEPVAAGAAACIHALIETENWEYASDETLQAVCQRITVALSEKSTRTVVHLQLASALASMNPDVLGVYGATLLRTAEEILKTAVDSWQHRKAAAKLLQGVLIILDKETLETEVDLAIHALESCRLDKMPHVRAAVSEALYAAKMLASGDSTQSCGVLSNPLCKSICKSMEQSSSGAWTKRDIDQSRSSWTTKGDVNVEHSHQSSWTERDSLNSPLQKRIVSPTSQESNQLSFSPASTSTTESMQISRHISTTPAGRSNSRRSNKRTPLYPARGMGFPSSSRCSSPGTLSPSGSVSEDCEFTLQKSHAKENVPARSKNVNTAFPIEEVGGQVQVLQAKANSQLPVPFTDAYTNPLIPSLQLENFADEILHTPESKNRDGSVLHNHAGKKEADSFMSRQHMMSPLISAILNELTETASSILAEDDAGLAQLDSQIEEARNLKPSSRNGPVLPRLRLGNFNSSPDSLSRSGYAASGDNSNQSFSSPTTVQRDENNRPVGGNDVRISNECVEGKGVAVGTRDVDLAAMMDTVEEDSAPGREGSNKKPLQGSGVHDLKHHYNALAQLDFNAEKSQPLITAKDFLPYATPKRLMRALQSLSASTPDPRRVSMNEEASLCQDLDAAPSAADIDVEASSEAGWSVRDNPIASDESFQADSSDEKLEDRQLKLGAQIQNNNHIPSTDCSGSPRDIHMLSPACRDPRLVERIASPIATPTQAQNCDVLCSTFNSDVHNRFITSSEGRNNYSPVLEDSNGGDVDVFSGLLAGAQLEDKVVKSGSRIRCDCRLVMAASEVVEFPKLSERSPLVTSWWDSRELGRGFMLVRLVARNWRHLCWYGEIVLGGTLCVVLTLPLAMALAKALNSTPEHLVPT